VTDPEALDLAEGPRALLRIDVPVAWLESGAAIEVAVPRLLPCARCDGGGCDGCDRSGALRAPAGERSIELRLPGGAATEVRVRLVQPFEDSTIQQLLVEVRGGDAPGANVRLLAVEPKRLALPLSAWVALAIAVIAAVAALWW
jgi:hypothetical protein